MNQIITSQPIIKHLASSALPTQHGLFAQHAFGFGDKATCLALVAGVPRDGCLVRLHSACMTGDVFGSNRCDCGKQLEQAMKLVAEEGSGLVIYLLDHEGRGNGLLNKVKAYNLQDGGMDSVEADLHLGLPVDVRDFVPSARIVRHHFGLSRVRLLSNNPDKIAALEQVGVRVEREDFWPDINPHNRFYIDTKREKLGHLALAS